MRIKRWSDTIKRREKAPKAQGDLILYNLMRMRITWDTDTQLV